LVVSWWNDKKYNLIGKTFGKLKVIEDLGYHNRCRRWKCECECGQITEVSGHNLKAGSVVSCGCSLKGCNKKRPYEWLYNTLVSVGKEVGITYEDFLEFTKVSQCHYCDFPVQWRAHGRADGKGSRAYNLDRKDNLLGYVKDNLVVCCVRCNRAKMDHFTYDEFIKIGKVIKTFAKP
jgi:hypothetical protein